MTDQATNQGKNPSAQGQDPLWFKDAVIYQLSIKSFFDSNNDGFGDLRGLIEKLDYIQELGVNTLWVLPFYPSPLRDDGYDIADYEGINPIYGNMDDFEQLLKEAHHRGLRVITELVINHTSDQHPWFQAARRAPKNSPERNFYVWSDNDQAFKDARIIFVDYEQSNWTWDPMAKQFFWHRFFSHQPDLNFDNQAVFDAVAQVMRQWFELGVDGVRLDAIPYLVEREGTNCENLPETHAVIKRLRKIVDQEFPDRIFLAEANQWPKDVRQYFGNGDECHMAYHFPLMPRLYLALHQEDREPITSILDQTPEIPTSCQWAMFLRNHDELTLEMVDETEREQMYRAYAPDPRMRSNVGIRRRLASLMDFSRPKIELLNSLLFSMPGTPIVYYGDEIGMGDNIFLEDRHGLRTPMQWSADRNGGFSQAPASQLYCQPIADPIASYQAINVESQLLNPSSLLNWMRTIIRLRNQHQVFGRGTLEFLPSSNEKVLAYIRKMDDEVVLIVANLSRHPQSVSLNLDKYHSLKPVEMFGAMPFHPIVNDEPYVLTLGPHQFYWLLLLPSKQPIPIEPTSELPGLPKQEPSARGLIPILDCETEDVFAQLISGNLSKKFESEVLPTFVAKQRWFARKSQQIESARIVDWTPIPKAAEQSGLLITEITCSDKSKDFYAIYIAVSSGYQAQEMIEFSPDNVLVDLRVRSESFAVYDALGSDPFCKQLLSLVQSESSLSTQKGLLTGSKIDEFDDSIAISLEQPVQRVPAEQSNSSIAFGKELVLKLYRKLQPGINPDYEICQFLTQDRRLTHVPAVAGGMNYLTKSNGKSEQFVLGLLQKYIVHQADGWSYTTAEYRRYFERAASHTYMLNDLLTPDKTLEDLVDETIPQEAVSMLGVYLDEAEKLGRRTGELHSALAQGKDAAFAPELLKKEELVAITMDMKERVEAMLVDLAGETKGFTGELLQQAQELTAHKNDLFALIDQLNATSSALMKTRVHGDYHLGQILNTGGDFVIFDFEGEPGRPLAERRHKQTPLKDVAGMVRSFSYAAYASLFEFTKQGKEDVQKFWPWATVAQTWSSVSFLKGYLDATKGQSFIPKDKRTFFVALMPFMIDKAAYEINYELNNRPDWIRIPVSGLLECLKTKGPTRV